jgi:phosphoglycolate phosphatase-like HAD superfamily hydrolase
MHIFLFDIDGTLLASGGAGKAAMELALASCFGVPADSGTVPYAGRTDRSIVRDLFRLHQVEDTPTHFQQFVSAYLGHLPDCLHRHQGRVLPGIMELLDRLAQHDQVAVGLLTGNMRRGAHVKLSHFGLGDRFAFGGFGDDHWERDDVARAAFATVCEQHGEVAPDRVWVIGDTPLDVQCARAIGAQVAAVATGYHSVDQLAATRPDLLFADLSDPSELLARLGVPAK